jgi:protoporphyrinogen IX oxidase
MSWLVPFYPWVKALHIVSVVAWMAGLLYLPRLFVYHAVEAPGSATGETFKIMERRLLRAIMNPAMISTYVFGILLAATPGIVDWSSMWIYCKLALVLGLTVAHEQMTRWSQDFASDRNTRPQRFFRIANEVPTLLMILIVILVVVKPF